MRADLLYADTTNPGVLQSASRTMIADIADSESFLHVETLVMD